MTKKIKISNVEVSVEDFKKAMEENKDVLEGNSGRVKERRYWFLDTFGGASYTADLFLSEDDYRYLTGNYFLAKQEALDHKAYLEALGRVQLDIREANDGWKPDWGDVDEYKYYIHFDHDLNKLQVSARSIYEDAMLLGYIRSRDDAQKIMETHEDDLLLVFNYKQPKC